jgi:hypothetical protein
MQVYQGMHCTCSPRCPAVLLARRHVEPRSGLQQREAEMLLLSNVTQTTYVLKPHVTPQTLFVTNPNQPLFRKASTC